MDEGRLSMEFGLIGEKLGYSYSKIIHEQLIDNYSYEIHPIAKEDLDSFMKEKKFKAINVTIPYKEAVIPYLNEMSDVAKKIGAVNTIVNDNGKLKGYNTDYLGFAYTLDYYQINVEHKKVLILGKGGASKAVQAVVLDKGASQVIITALHPNDTAISTQEAYQYHNDAQIIINTTPCGTYPNVDDSAVDISKFSQCIGCVDIVYNPLHTQFILQAKQLNIPYATGLDMLVGQAKYALEFFKSIHIEDSEIQRLTKQILLETCNILVVDNDMLAKQLATTLNKEYIILEDNIQRIKEIGIQKNYIISTSKQVLTNKILHDIMRNSLYCETKETNIQSVLKHL